MIKTIIRILMVIIIIGIGLVYWLRLGFDNFVIRDGLYLSSVVLALAGCLFALQKYGVKNARSITLLCVTGAVFCLFVGEMIFEYHFLTLKHDIPFPSIGDIFYLASYPLFFAGLYHEIRLANVNWRKLNKGIWLVLISVSLILAVVVYHWGIIAGYDPAEKLFTNIVAMSYGVADLFLIILSLFLAILVMEYRGGRFAKIWFILMAGFVFSLSCDLLHEFFITEYHNEVWFWKSFIDTISMFIYLAYALAMFEFGFSILDAIKQAGISENVPVTVETQKAPEVTSASNEEKK